MEISILLIKQILSFMLMGIAGYALRRAGVITHEESRGITAVCVYICTPCTVFEAFQTEITQERMAGFLYAVLAVIVLHLAFFGLAWLIGRFYPMSVVEANSVIYSNSGNLVIPLIIGVFGAEYVFYSSAYLFIQTILLWTHARMTISNSGKVDWKKILLHPCMIAIFAGFLFLLSGWKLPEIVDQALTGLSSCIGPLSMLIVGMLIAEVDLKSIFLNSRIYIMTLLRLLVFPAAAFVCIDLLHRIFPVRVNSVVCLIVLLAASAPAATTITQLAQMYDHDAGYASSLSILTTLGSIVTMPLVVMAAQVVL